MDLSNPLMTFVIGLAVGLLIALMVKINAWLARRSLEKENASLLRNHVRMHDTGHKSLTAELETLKKQNENLRVTVATLKSKTEKTDLYALHTYDKAIRLMTMRAPGFAPSWEMALAEAETEMQQVDTGMLAWVKRAIRPSLGSQPGHVISQSVNQDVSSVTKSDLVR